MYFTIISRNAEINNSTIIFSDKNREKGYKIMIWRIFSDIKIPHQPIYLPSDRCILLEKLKLGCSLIA